MIPEMLYSNLASWAAQVFVIASLGALLPQVFRIRHPRTQLAYGHLVLAVCLALPLIQPWQPLMPSLPGAAIGIDPRCRFHVGADCLVDPRGWFCLSIGMADGGNTSHSQSIGLRRLRFVRFPSLSDWHASAFVLRRCLASRPT